MRESPGHGPGGLDKRQLSELKDREQQQPMRFAAAAPRRSKYRRQRDIKAQRRVGGRPEE